MKKIKEESGRGQVLTIGTAKALIGKTIETYTQGYADQSYRDKFVIDKCLLSYNGYHPVGKRATITKVDWNTKQSKDIYPLFAVYIDVLP